MYFNEKFPICKEKNPKNKFFFKKNLSSPFARFHPGSVGAINRGKEVPTSLPLPGLLFKPDPYISIIAFDFDQCHGPVLF
jgi:hypothetical protein